MPVPPSMRLATSLPVIWSLPALPITFSIETSRSPSSAVPSKRLIVNGSAGSGPTVFWNA